MTPRDLVLRAIEGHRPNSGNWVRARCPLCLATTGTPDRHAALSANLESGYYGCFRCGTKGWLRDRDEAPKPKITSWPVPMPGLPEFEVRYVYSRGQFLAKVTTTHGTNEPMPGLPEFEVCYVHSRGRCTETARCDLRHGHTGNCSLAPAENENGGGKP